MKTLKCSGQDNCIQDVTHIDEKGFVYCARHGEIRKQYMRCRKLTTKELKQLSNDMPLKNYEGAA